MVYGGSGAYSYNWSPSVSLSDPTMLQPTASPGETTTYTLIVTDQMGCSVQVDFKVVVDNSNASNELHHNTILQAKLAPNPNSGQFNIQLEGLPSPFIQLTFIDMCGRTMKTLELHNFDGEHVEAVQCRFPAGIYTVHITSTYESINQTFIIR